MHTFLNGVLCEWIQKAYRKWIVFHQTGEWLTWRETHTAQIRCWMAYAAKRIIYGMRWKCMMRIEKLSPQCSFVGIIAVPNVFRIVNVTNVSKQQQVERFLLCERVRLIALDTATTKQRQSESLFKKVSHLNWVSQHTNQEAKLWICNACCTVCSTCAPTWSQLLLNNIYLFIIVVIIIINRWIIYWNVSELMRTATERDGLVACILHICSHYTLQRLSVCMIGIVGTHLEPKNLSFN